MFFLDCRLSILKFKINEKAGKHRNLYALEDSIKPNRTLTRLVNKIKNGKGYQMLHKQNGGLTQTNDIEHEQSEDLIMLRQFNVNKYQGPGTDRERNNSYIKSYYSEAVTRGVL